MPGIEEATPNVKMWEGQYPLYLKVLCDSFFSLLCVHKAVKAIHIEYLKEQYVGSKSCLCQIWVFFTERGHILVTFHL